MNSRNYAFSYYIHSLILSVIFILFVPIKIILYLKPGDFAELAIASSLMNLNFANLKWIKCIQDQDYELPFLKKFA